MRRPPWGHTDPDRGQQGGGTSAQGQTHPQLYFVCPAVFGEVLNYISVFKNQKVSLTTLNF